MLHIGAKAIYIQKKALSEASIILANNKAKASTPAPEPAPERAPTTDQENSEKITSSAPPNGL